MVNDKIKKKQNQVSMSLPFSFYLIQLCVFFHDSIEFSTELMFLETSALTGENVEEGFLKCARSILNKIDSGTSAICLFKRCV